VAVSYRIGARQVGRLGLLGAGVVLGLLALPAVAHGQHAVANVSGLEDEQQLADAGREFDVPSILMWVHARQESGIHGNNKARGPGFIVVQRDARGDSIGYKRICREIGRMQILPCRPDSKGKIQPIDWTWLTPHCNKKKNLYAYDHNIRCGAAILAYNYQKYGSWMEVVKRYNGSGDQAEEYRARVEQILGKIVLRMVEKAQSDSAAVSLAGFAIGR